MRRHAVGLIVPLVLSFLVGLLAVEAQPSAKVPRIGLLSPFFPATGHTEGDPLGHATVDAFRQALQELGYMEGKTILIEYRWAEGHPERLAELAADLVRLQVDVIVTVSMKGVRAARHATATIPIVSGGAGDLVRGGLVASLARPGGNVTGLSDFGGHLFGKRLELLKEVVPTASRIAFLWRVGNPTAPLNLQALQATAPALGVTLLAIAVAGPDDVDRALTAMAQERPEALVVHPSAAGTPDDRRRVFEFAVQHRLPAIYTHGQWVETGGLMSYGTHFPDLWRRAATYVQKILQGTKPAEIPVEQPMKFELVINVHTAQQMGLTIPPSVLYQADRVMQ